MHDISKIIRGVRAKYPPDERTARHLLVLLEATRLAMERSGDAIRSRGALSGEPERQRRAMLRELRELRLRLDGYGVALSKVAPAAAMPPDARRLLHLVMWKPGMAATLRHPMPDFATPFKIDNEFQQLNTFYAFQWGKFVEYLDEELEEVARTVGKAAGKVVEVAQHVVGSAVPWVLGGLGVLVAGGITYAVVTRK